MITDEIRSRWIKEANSMPEWKLVANLIIWFIPALLVTVCVSMAENYEVWVEEFERRDQ